MQFYLTLSNVLCCMCSMDPNHFFGLGYITELMLGLLVAGEDFQKLKLATHAYQNSQFRLESAISPLPYVLESMWTITR